MKVNSLLVLCAFLFSLNAIAQNPDRIVVFGGYSRMSYPIGNLYSGPWPYSGYNGWEASAAGKVAPHLALEADFGGEFTSTYSTSLKTYMGGPRFFANFGRIGVFGHVLFGALTLDRGFPTASATSFAAALGGGADYWVGRHWGVQLGQIDYIRNTNSAAGFQVSAGTQPSSDLRISTGIVFRF